MANRLDIAERLAEGRPAVEHTQSYVRACELVGYQHPDLMSYPAQIRDWYYSEDGLDLHALDGDCAQLRAAGATVMEALRMQRAQVDELSAAWAGPAADAAIRFLQRHCDAGNLVATEVRAAAQRCESLRDNLWQLVDSKVATAIAIDDRTLAQRPGWLAAAAAVTSGLGDRSTAEEVVGQQVKPYVDNDIRNDWLTAMRSMTAGVATSYDMVTDRFASAARAYFEIPSDLGPSSPPLRSIPPTAPTAAAAVTPVAAHPTLAPDPAPAQALAARATPTTPTSPTAPAPLTRPDLGAALGDGSASPADPGGSGGLAGLGGLGGLASRIVDAMGGLLGSAAEQLSDDPLGDEDPFGADDADDEDDDEAEKAAEPAPRADGVVEAAQLVDGTPPAAEPPTIAQPAAGPPATAPAPQVAPPPVNGLPATPPATGSTPCEIAADELPKAGQ